VGVRLGRRPNIPVAGPIARVDIADGKVFATQKDGSIIALDQKTGTKLWQTYLNDEDRPHVAQQRAAVLRRLDLLGVSGAGQATRAASWGFERQTGQNVWKFNTVPGARRAKLRTWEGDTGSGAVRTSGIQRPSTPSWAWCNSRLQRVSGLRGAARVDEPVLLVGHRGSISRRVPNKWHFRAPINDMWDYDIGVTPMLVRTVITAKNRAKRSQCRPSRASCSC